MKIQNERLITYGFLFALAILVVVCIVAYQSTMHLIQASRDISHQKEILRTSESLMSFLTDAETGGRGFLLTRKEEYLEPYHQALQEIEPTFNSLYSLTAHESVQQESLRDVRSLIQTRLMLLKQAIDLQRQNGLSEELRNNLNDRGKKAMDAIRALLQRFEMTEEQELTRSIEISEQTATRTILILFSGIVLAFLVIIPAISLIQQNLRLHRDSENALRKAHDELEKRVHERTAELMDKNRALKTISECNQILVRAHAESDLLKQICQAVVEVGGYNLAWVGLASDVEKDAQKLQLVTTAGNGASISDRSEDFLELAENAVRSRTPQVFRSSESKIALPLVSDGEALGALSIHSREANAFDAEEVKLLTELANDLSYGISTLRTRAQHAQARKELQQSEQRFQLFMENLPGVAWMKDEDGRYIYINNAWQKEFGRTADDVLGKTSYDLWPPEVAEKTEANDHLVVTTREPAEMTSSVPTKRGIRHWLAVKFPIIPHPDSAVLIGGMAIDITERKNAEEERDLLLEKERRHAEELERRVAERTAELQAANNELEAFSYSVSHDLRAPLRAIDGFSKALLEDYDDKLDQEGKDYLKRVRAATQRMGQLIDDLLNLSRVSRTEMNRQQVDLSTLATATINELQKSDPLKKLEFVVEPSLIVNADFHLIKIVLENLLSNAWKFSSKQPAARIQFGKNEESGRAVFFVQDNGVGFENAYVGRLFAPFQRLHSQQEFEGTGIGLATVQRIVRRHGGEVWAEGNPNHGATFYFTIS